MKRKANRILIGNRKGKRLLERHVWIIQQAVLGRTIHLMFIEIPHSIENEKKIRRVTQTKTSKCFQKTHNKN
jgi:hypothetical protein